MDYATARAQQLLSSYVASELERRRRAPTTQEMTAYVLALRADSKTKSAALALIEQGWRPPMPQA